MKILYLGDIGPGQASLMRMRVLEGLAARIRGGELTPETHPDVPTDEQWAEQVCRECGWLTREEARC